MAEATSDARAPGRGDRPALQVLAESHDLVSAIALHPAVVFAMAICTYENALCRLFTSPTDTAVESSERETLVTRVPMVKLKCPDTSVVAAVFAVASAGLDQLRLDLEATAPAIRHVGGKPPDATLAIGNGSGRCVVRAERRAVETEDPARKDTPDALDDGRVRDRRPAGSAYLHLTKIGTPLRADPAPRGGLEPPTWRLLVPPGFPGTWTISSPSPSPVLGAGCIVSEPSRGVSSGSAADCHGACAL